MIGEEVKVFGVEKFDDTDFEYWRLQIEDYLYRKRLHLSILGERSDSMEDADWNILDHRSWGLFS